MKVHLPSDGSKSILFSAQSVKPWPTKLLVGLLGHEGWCIIVSTSNSSRSRTKSEEKKTRLNHFAASRNVVEWKVLIWRILIYETA
jgi:hypothetical protein